MTDRIESLLEDMHRATLGADFSALASLAPEVEAAALALDPQRDPAAALRIAALARRNASCLDAALRGLRAGRRRLAEMRGISQGLRTYDRHGQPADIVTSSPPPRRF